MQPQRFFALTITLAALATAVPAQAQEPRSICGGMLHLGNGHSERRATPAGTEVTYHADLLNRRYQPTTVRIMMFSVPGNLPVVSTGGGAVHSNLRWTSIRIVTIRLQGDAAAPSVDSILSNVRWLCA